MISGTVAINGQLLRVDRERALLSRDALAAATQGHVSAETIRRAETGKRVFRAKIDFIAEALGQQSERYTIDIDNSDGLGAAALNLPDLNGRWFGYWIETHRRGEPFVCMEEIELSQTGQLVKGSFRTIVDEQVREERINFARLDRRTLICVTSVVDWVNPNGISSFQLHIGRNDNWMDGYTMWDDADTEQVEVSRYICVKAHDAEISHLKALAAEMMEGAVEAFKWRRSFWNS